MFDESAITDSKLQDVTLKKVPSKEVGLYLHTYIMFCIISCWRRFLVYFVFGVMLLVVTLGWATPYRVAGHTYGEIRDLYQPVEYLNTTWFVLK